jgi:hypothetical protein
MGDSFLLCCHAALAIETDWSESSDVCNKYT